MINPILKATIIGGLIIFIWGMISWMVLPWHEKTLHSFKDETAVARTITDNATVSGIYFLPSMESAAKTSPQQSSVPQLFAAVKLDGMSKSMIQPMIISLITQFIIVSLAAWLLMQTCKLSYFHRFVFLIVFAVAASIMTNIPYWNWFGFSMDYTLVMIADSLVGWILAGLVIAKLVPGKTGYQP